MILTVSHRDRDFACRMFWEDSYSGRGWECEAIEGIRTLAGRELSDEQAARWLRLAGRDVERIIEDKAVDAAEAYSREDWS